MKMKNTLAFLFLFIIGLTHSNAQNLNTNPYWNGEIYLADGTTKTGMIMVPNSSQENYMLLDHLKKAKKKR